MRVTAVSTLLLLLALLSCQREPPAVPALVQYSVPTEVEPYVQRFRDELGRRGQALTINNLIVAFGQTQGIDVCGECQLAPGQTPRILLATTDFCWKNASENERECLVFHELGHCLLNRGHRSDRFPNHAYVSLMNPDDRAVYATCAYPIGNDVCDKRPRRAYYLDELADVNTPTPVWGH